EHMAPEVIAEKRKIYKGVNANVDFYSGLVYSMLGIPSALYTPIFAAARIVGWSAHRLEELIDRKSTRLNSSHVSISYAVFCLKGYVHDRCLHSFPTRRSSDLRAYGAGGHC